MTNKIGKFPLVPCSPLTPRFTVVNVTRHFRQKKTSLKPSEDVYKKADDVQLNKSVKKIITMVFIHFLSCSITKKIMTKLKGNIFNRMLFLTIRAKIYVLEWYLLMFQFHWIWLWSYFNFYRSNSHHKVILKIITYKNRIFWNWSSCSRDYFQFYIKYLVILIFMIFPIKYILKHHPKSFLF